MSLKAFHIVFIGISSLLALGCAAWEFNNFIVTNDNMHLLLGVLALASAVGLVVYGVRFMRKLKHVKMI